MARNWVSWVLAQVEEIEDRFNLTGSTYTGHDDTNGYGEQYAADFWTTDKAKHDAVFSWFIANAKDIGGLYIISRDRIWNIERADEGVRHYERDANNDGVLSASERHTNHVHMSFDPHNPPEEDMPTVKEIWIGSAADVIPSPDESTKWQPGSYLRNIYNRVDTVEATQAAQNRKLDAILAALAALQQPPA